MDGEKIKKLREEKRISQEELAEMSQVSRATISFIETNKPSSVKLDTLTKLAKALDVTVKDFL